MLIYAAHVESRQFLGLISVKKLRKNKEAFTRPSQIFTGVQITLIQKASPLLPVIIIVVTRQLTILSEHLPGNAQS